MIFVFVFLVPFSLFGFVLQILTVCFFRPSLLWPSEGRDLPRRLTASPVPRPKISTFSTRSLPAVSGRCVRAWGTPPITGFTHPCERWQRWCRGGLSCCSCVLVFLLLLLLLYTFGFLILLLLSCDYCCSCCYRCYSCFFLLLFLLLLVVVVEGEEELFGTRKRARDVCSPWRPRHKKLHQITWLFL